jgi:hypothetical protein
MPCCMWGLHLWKTLKGKPHLENLITCGKYYVTVNIPTSVEKYGTKNLVIYIYIFAYVFLFHFTPLFIFVLLMI